VTRNVKFLVGAVVVGLVALLATVLLTRKDAAVQPLDPATGDTTGVSGTLPAVTAPTTPARWSDTADAAFTTVRSAIAGDGSLADVEALFGVPVEVPQPDDARLDHARYGLVAGEGGSVEESWSLWSTSSATPAELESAFTSGFSSDAFTPGPRTEHEFAGFTITGISYSPTAAGEAAGWVYMNVSIGPDTDGVTPTDRSFLRVDLTRVLGGMPDATQLPAFASGWLAEVPVADGLALAELSAEAGTQPADRVWLSARFTAPQDQFPALVSFYGHDHTEGALVYPQSAMPEGIDDLEYFQHDGSPTLAGHAFTVSVDRYLPEPEFPAAVNLAVKLESTD
jgi:hypothetical protein